MYQIKNDLCLLEVDNKAAEVHVFKKIGEDYNYVWCGDSAYWSGRNPILFPQVSSNEDKTIKVDGVKYQTGNHGFARNQIFSLIDQKEDELTLGIETSQETLKQYPFEFSLKVNYKLEGKQLKITYTIENRSEKVMPYGFGLHPAFTCCHEYKDTKVIFNKAEEKCGDSLIISKELFEQYPTYEIKSPKADKATLISGSRKIAVTYPGFKEFAIWSKGDFVCLEPWMNHTDKNSEVELKDRPGIEFLNPHQSRTIKYAWIIED